MLRNVQEKSSTVASAEICLLSVIATLLRSIDCDGYFVGPSSAHHRHLVFSPSVCYRGDDFEEQAVSNGRLQSCRFWQKGREGMTAEAEVGTDEKARSPEGLKMTATAEQVMHRVVRFTLDTMPVGVISYDKEMRLVFSNEEARKLLSKCRLPHELRIITERIFRAIKESRFKEVFPGEIIFSRRLKGSASRWTFSFRICTDNDPFVCIYILENRISASLDFDSLRRRFQLTRRENDIVRRVINGMKNTEIAQEFGISEQTIKDHMSNIYSKIGVSRRFELLAFLTNCVGDSSVQ